VSDVAQTPPRATRVILRGLGLIGRAIREQPAVFTVAVVGAAVYGGLGVGMAFIVGQVVGRVVVPALDQHQTTRAALAIGFGVLMAVAVLKVAALFARRLGASTIQFRLTASYRRRVIRRYLALPPAWHRRHATGTLLSNASSDVEALWTVLSSLPLAVGTLVMLVVAVGGIFAVDWAFGLVALALFVLLFGLNFLYSRRMAPRIARAQALRAQVSAVAHESFDGALVVKTMGRESAETRRFEARAHELRDAMISVGRLRGVFDPLTDAGPNLASLAVLVVGVLRQRQGAVTVEEIFSVSFLFAMLAVPVRSIAYVLTEIPRSVAGWDRVSHVLAATGDMPYGDGLLPDAAGQPVGVVLRDVHFAYEDAADGEAVAGVSFEVPAGATVALVGPTGSGKSTIASLAVRLVDPGAGTVELGGVDARTLSSDQLARTVAIVPQLPFVFDDTVRGNVALDRDEVDDDRVRRALALAQAQGFIDRLPEGLDTPLGERGSSLSGGQRQRLTLARALAGSPRLLVLDDATSAVDPRVEAAILGGLRRAGGTILVVAYRRATIALADQVVYLERGRVVARGGHPELLATVPAYAELVTAYERADAEREQELAEQDVRPPVPRGEASELADVDGRAEELVEELVEDAGRAGAVS
jgi:ABC-type multidrug transport system fused ATPase/permease subunit